MRVFIIATVVFILSMTAAQGQSYYYKRGHNQDFKLSGIGFDFGYYYPLMRFYNVVYLPEFGADRFTGNVIFGGHLDFHLRDGIYLKGSANYFRDKVQTDVGTFNNQSWSEEIDVQVGMASLALIYEIQVFKRFYPYVGAGFVFNRYLIKKAEQFVGREPRRSMDLGDKIQLLGQAGVNYTINGRLDIGLEGRVNYGRFIHNTKFRPTNDVYIDNKIGMHGFMLFGTVTFRMDSRFLRRKVGKYWSNPGTSVKRW